MNDRLRGRSALITGATGAFGRATMIALRRCGMSVRGLDLRADIDVFECDITDPAAVGSAVELAAEELGGIDLLVNCAGIGRPIDAGGPADTAKGIAEVNLWGQWNVTSAALPRLLASGGRIVFVASALVYATVPFTAAYAVAERGLTAYADALRVEYGGRLNITTIYPGYVDTPIHAATESAGLTIAELARTERIDDVVATIVKAAATRHPPRECGTSVIGRLQLSVAKHLPRVADGVIGRRIRALARRGRYRDAAIAQPMLARQGLAVAAPRPVASHTVTAADGVRLRTWVGGPPRPKAAVVYLHGWCLSSEIYRYQRAEMERLGAGARLVEYDIRGHGLSDPAPPGTTTITQLARDLRAVVEQVCEELPVILVGHSLGGMTIMELAASAPDFLERRIAGVALVNTSAGQRSNGGSVPRRPLSRLAQAVLLWEFSRRTRAQRRRGTSVIRRRLTDTAIARNVLFGSEVSGEDLRLGRRLIATAHPAVMAGFWPELLAHDRGWALPRLATMPVRILAGSRDRLTPLRHSRAIARELPNARLVEFPGVGHTIPLERGGELAVEVAEIVRQVAGDGGPELSG